MYIYALGICSTLPPPIGRYEYESYYSYSVYYGYKIFPKGIRLSQKYQEKFFYFYNLYAYYNITSKFEIYKKS